MQGLESRIERVLEDQWDGPLWLVAQAILEEIKPAVVSMFRVMEQPGMPPLTPEERWEAMVRDMQEDDE